MMFPDAVIIPVANTSCSNNTACGIEAIFRDGNSVDG